MGKCLSKPKAKPRRSVQMQVHHAEEKISFSDPEPEELPVRCPPQESEFITNGEPVGSFEDPLIFQSKSRPKKNVLDLYEIYYSQKQSEKSEKVLRDSFKVIYNRKGMGS